MSTRTFGVPLMRSELICLPPHPEERRRSWPRWALERGKPIAVDLFCGCGGLSLGLEDAGYSVILSVDNDEKAVETHRHNLPGLVLNRDLSDSGQVDRLVSLLEGIPVDLIAGGPPCQPFSRAGKSKIRSLVQDGSRPEEDTRKDLWRAFLEIVSRVKPRALLIENVPDMALGEDLRLLRTILGELDDVGYDADARLLDAWRYGVPQHRQRLIIVGRNDGRPFEWPSEQKKVTVRQAIGDLPALGRTTGKGEMAAGAARTQFQQRARKGMEGSRVVWDHTTRAVRDDDREAFKLMKPGTRYSDLPKELRRYRSDIFDDKYNRLSWDEVSRSITAHIAKDGYWYIHPAEQRTLTVREAARIQTFPDRFRFAGSRSHAFRQIGNAVPPALGEAVGRELLKSNKIRPLSVANRNRERIRSIRDDLAEWARGDRKQAPWRYPGDPWAALAGVVLGDRVGTADDEVRAFLDAFPTASSGGGSKIKQYSVERARQRAKAYKSVSEVATWAARKRDPWGSDDWISRASLGTQEEAHVRLLTCPEPLVFASAAALRVTGRLLGDIEIAKGRGSHSKIEIAKLVGIGKEANLVGAALHSLGRSLCGPGDPNCAPCPLRKNCTSRGAD